MEGLKTDEQEILLGSDYIQVLPALYKGGL